MPSVGPREQGSQTAPSPTSHRSLSADRALKESLIRECLEAKNAWEPSRSGHCRFWLYKIKARLRRAGRCGRRWRAVLAAVAKIGWAFTTAAIDSSMRTAGTCWIGCCCCGARRSVRIVSSSSTISDGRVDGRRSITRNTFRSELSGQAIAQRVSSTGSHTAQPAAESWHRLSTCSAEGFLALPDR